MSFIRSPLTLINPLHSERCIAPSPLGGVCPGSIDFATRVSAHIELSLSQQKSNPETRAINFRNAARLMICGRHQNPLQEVRRVARLWEEEATQQSEDIIRSLASTETPSYTQTPQKHMTFGGGIESSTRH